MSDMYNEKVMDHFMNPRNVGEIQDADGMGTYGSPLCGDKMDISLKIVDDRIVDAKFKTFGCGSAIASSSITTEMIIGKTVEEALALTNAEILEELGGLPDVKVHCSILADKALKFAIYDYAQKNNKEYEGLKDFDPTEVDHGHEEEEEE